MKMSLTCFLASEEYGHLLMSRGLFQPQTTRPIKCVPLSFFSYFSNENSLIRLEFLKIFSFSFSFFNLVIPNKGKKTILGVY